MADFDPYHKWLGIRPEDQPPHHYRLLGISAFESDPDVIDTAAEQRLSYLKTCATGEHVAESQRLLNEVTAARLVLLTKEKKQAYDETLRATLPTNPADPSVHANGAAPAPNAGRSSTVSKSAPGVPTPSPAPNAKTTPTSRTGRSPIDSKTAAAAPSASATESTANGNAPTVAPVIVADEPRRTPLPPTRSKTARKGKEQERKKSNRDAPLVLAIGGSLLGLLGLVAGIWFFAFRTPSATGGAATEGAKKPQPKTAVVDGTGWPGGTDTSKKSIDDPAPIGTPGSTTTTPPGTIGPTGTDGPTGTTPVFEPPPPVTPAARVAAGPTLELLRIVDVRQDALRGSFAKVDGRVECVVPGSYRTLELPVIPRGDYVLRVKAARLAGEEGFQLYLPVGERPVRVLLDGMHNADPQGLSGIESVDGRRLNANTTAVRGFHFEQGRTHEIVAEVSSASGHGSVVVKVDDRELVRWTGPVTSLSVAPEPLRRSDALGVGVDNKVSEARIESVRLTMRTGEALFLRPMTSDTIVLPGSETTPNPVATTTPTTDPNPTTGTPPNTTLPPLGPLVGGRAPVPTDAHLELAEAKIKEIYGADYVAAKKAGEKRTLARRLLSQIDRFASIDELPVLYVVLRDARNFASAGGDANSVVAACDALAARFQVARIPLVAEGLQQTIRAATASDDVEALAVAAMSSVDRAIVDEEFEAADKLHVVASGSVQKVRIPALAARLQPIRSRVQEARTEHLRFRNALAAVETSPTDVAAWKTIGTYLCLWRSDWTKGIDALGRTGNTDLVYIAEQEKSRPTQAADQIRLADAWWDWIERQPGKTAHPFRAAAEFWYRTARPTASPNDRSKIDKRLEEIGSPEIFRDVPYGSPTEAVGRFAPLFNGRNLEGWTVRAGAPADWAVADGLLKSAARGSGWIGTHRTYRDFVFRCEYRMKGSGDSGILLRKAPDGTGGIQVQLIDDRRTDLFGIHVDPSGTVITFRRAKRSAVNPIGEWNRLEVRCQGRRIVVVLNNEVLVDGSVPTAHRDYGDEGTLGLELFHSTVEFRNLSLLEFLPPHPELAVAAK